MTAEISEAQLQEFFALDWPKYKAVLADVEKHRDEVSHNIISVSTYSGHLENYHSDVWGFLLDPTAAHRKGNQFLLFFIKYLIDNKFASNEYSAAFKNAQVYREKGRIDILIVNEEQKVCIIIENKINNAPDMDEQMERYRQKSLAKGWKIAAMLYVSLTGERLSTLQDADEKVQPIAACNGLKNSLLEGWLIPAKEAIPLSNDKTDENIRSFLHQYCLLLQNLTSKIMDNNANEFLYKMLGTRENFDIAVFIADNLNSISKHRAAVIEKKLENHFSPKNYFEPGFHKKTRSTDGNTVWLAYENFKYEKDRFILYVSYEKDKSKFAFWSKDQKYDVDQLRELLTRVLGNHDFSANGFDNQVGKTLHLSNTSQTLPEFDNAVANYSIKLFTKFNEFANK